MTTPSKPLYREVILTQGQVAIVDSEDYDLVSKHKWYALWDDDTKSYYAVRNEITENGHALIRMHRFLLGLGPGDEPFGDHENHNTLDNRRSSNLRIANVTESNRNRRRQRNNTSGTTGVSFDKSSGMWRAHIKIDGKQKNLGSRKDKAAAIALRREAEIVYFNDFLCRR
jgi:hypothetical protein